MYEVFFLPLIKLEFEYYEGTYAEYMDGQDQYDAYEKKLRDAIRK